MIESGGNKIGLFGAIAYCIGDIIGSGIFVSPTVILKHSGSVGFSLIVWGLSAIISCFGAFCYMELGTSIRKSGCDFAYLSHVGWHPFATAFLWVSCVMTYPAILAIQTMTFGEYVINGFENFLHVDEGQRALLVKLIGFSVLLPLLFLNCFSLKRIVSRFQILATVAKMIVVALVIITGFYFLIFKGKTQQFSSATVFEGSSSDVGEIALGFYAGLYAYNGWDILNFGTEEIENPRRTMPIAAITGIFVSASVFISMNIAYFSVLTVEEFKSADTVAWTFAEKTLGDFKYTVPFLIAILLLGNLNTTIFGCSRNLFSGGRRGVMPAAVRCVNEDSQSPRVAVFLEVFIAIGVSFIGDLDSLISYFSFAMWMQRTITQAAFIYMKLKGLNEHPDAFRVPIFVPIIFFCICLALLVVPVYQEPLVGVYGVCLLCGGLVIYFLFIYPKKLPYTFHKINDRTTRLAQIIFNVTPSEPFYESFSTESLDISEGVRKRSLTSASCTASRFSISKERL